jgi:hypothetical protein
MVKDYCFDIFNNTPKFSISNIIMQFIALNTILEKQMKFCHIFKNI